MSQSFGLSSTTRTSGLGLRSDFGALPPAGSPAPCPPGAAGRFELPAAIMSSGRPAGPSLPDRPGLYSRKRWPANALLTFLPPRLPPRNYVAGPVAPFLCALLPQLSDPQAVHRVQRHM